MLFKRKSIMKFLIILLFTALLFSSVLSLSASPAGKWMAGDLHVHSFLDGGDHTLQDIMDHAFGQYGLDWMASSGHGGVRTNNPEGIEWASITPPVTMIGNPPSGSMWRWQSLRDYSYPFVMKARKQFADKLIIQGFEWNVPGHGHASVGILGTPEKNGLAIAQFEYLFDEEDLSQVSKDTLGLDNKIMLNNHTKSLAAAKYLADNYPMNSYISFNHPSRSQDLSISHIRDFNNTAPTVCFGFEGIPGHGKEIGRGGYDNGPFKDTNGKDVTFKHRTYGGADYMVAKVGGVWDALLGEGRKFWVFTDSDFHRNTVDGDFYPGEYEKIYTYVQDKNKDGKYDLNELADSLRSGQSFAVKGSLINRLFFQVKNGSNIAMMGQTIRVKKGSILAVTVGFASPMVNNNGDKVKVNHIDLISGNVTGYAKPGTNAYRKNVNESAHVIKTFTKSKFAKTSDGLYSITYKVKADKPMYFRLRGTNLAPNTKNETDSAGNPLNDDLVGTNNSAKAYADLWFYSNPIFVEVVE